MITIRRSLKSWSIISPSNSSIFILSEARSRNFSVLILTQSLEKYLKVFIIKRNWNLRKIHELDALLDEASKYQQDLETIRDLCEPVSGYYFAERYPPLRS